MKEKMMQQLARNSLLPALLCLVLVLSTLYPVGAQQDIGQVKGVKVTSLQTLKAETLAPRFAQLLQTDKATAALARDLQKSGFQPQTSNEDYIGWEAGFLGQDGRQAVATMIFQDYTKPDTKEQAVLGKITISSGNNSASYDFSLFAAGDNFTKSREYKVDKNFNVVRAHSWWTCVLNRTSSNCSGDCGRAFSSCNGPWYSYIACVVSRCFCVLGSMICCGCNCTGWCSWFSGCCHQ